MHACWHARSAKRVKQGEARRSSRKKAAVAAHKIWEIAPPLKSSIYTTLLRSGVGGDRKWAKALVFKARGGGGGAEQRALAAATMYVYYYCRKAA